MIRRGVPTKFYLHTGLAGISAALIFPGWYRQLSLYFGVHMLSSLTFIVSVLLCFAIGLSVFGRVADKTKNPLRLFVFFLSVFIIYVFFGKAIFSEIISIYLKSVSHYIPGTFGTGLLRLLSSLCFLMIPVSFYAGLLPLLIKYFIRNINQSGLLMSATLFSACTGSVIGILLAVLLLIPGIGVQATILSGAFIMMVSLVFTVFDLFKNKSPFFHSSLPLENETLKKSIRFKKKKIVLESGKKLTKAMLYGSFFQGFTFMSMMILFLRILIRYNIVNTAFFYALIFLISLIGVAIGSMLYKRISEKPANIYLTLATMQVISGFGAILSMVLITVFAESIYSQLSGTKTFTILILKQSLLFCLLILIPSILNGISFPITGRLYTKRMETVGKNFGRLTSLIFLSMTLGITFTPYVLIPLLGIQLTYFFLSLMVLLSGIFLIFRDSRLIRGFRLGYAFSAFLLFIFAIAVLRMYQSGHRDNAADRTLEGSTSSVKALTHEDGSRLVFLNGDYYFGTDMNSRKEQVLSAGIPFFIHPQINSALVIGFGTGITGAVLDKFNIGEIMITEIYPEIVRLSSDIFAYENNDILTSSRVNIVIDDARSFMIRTSKQFDVITFGADQIMKFPGRCTTEFYRICRNKITDNGIMCQIIPLNSLSYAEFLALYHSCADVFEHLSFWYLSPSKLLMVSSKKDYSIDFCRVSDSFGTYNTQTLFESIKIYDPESFVAHMISKDELITTDNSASNTDNMPLVEFEHKLPKNGDITGLIKSVRDYSKIIEFNPDCTIDSAAVISKIKQINQSLLQQVSPFSSKEQRHDVDFFEQTGLLIRQYL